MNVTLTVVRDFLDWKKGSACVIEVKYKKVSL